MLAWARAKRRCGVAFEGLETTVSMSEVRMRRHSNSSLIIVVSVSLLLAHTPKAGAIPLPEPEPVVVERVSVGFDGEQGNNRSSSPTLSDNGRFVAFSSDAFNLVGMEKASGKRVRPSVGSIRRVFAAGYDSDTTGYDTVHGD